MGIIEVAVSEVCATQPAPYNRPLADFQSNKSIRYQGQSRNRCGGPVDIDGVVVVQTHR